MKSLSQIRRKKWAAVILSFGLLLVINYSNCAPVSFKPAANGSASVSGNLSGAVTVSPTGTNPPLDLFFIIDNSASMYGNQVKLASGFNSIFNSNSSSLSNFNVNVYLFSTASTVNLSLLSQVSMRSPASVSSIPTYSDISDLLLTPGSVFSYWNNNSGTYGTAPFSEQFNPAPVLALDSANNYDQALYIAKQGTQTASQYQAAINSLSQDFQNRLNYLNPNNQFQSGTSDAASNITDVSSGLCSVARILKHSSNFIQPGDAAAFIIVSDDDDRLNENNPNDNQCLESVIASTENINGSCGHYQSKFNFDTTSNITYQENSKFTYTSGTNIPYSYPSGASCQIQYNNGYNYSWTYTALNTLVSFTKCNLMADGFCVNSGPATKTISGNYVGSGNSCLSGATNSGDNVLAGTTPSCTANNVSAQAGTGGVDTNSNGQTCSSALIATLSTSTKQYQSCTITGQATTTTNVAAALVNSSAQQSCANACSGHSGCTLLNAALTTSSASLALNGVGLTCSSLCPSGDTCGTGTILSYIGSQHAGATCGTPSNILSNITVLSSVDSSGQLITCSSNLGSITVQNSGGVAVCAGASTVSSCINNLQVGAGATCASASGQTTSLPATTLNVGCTTSCASSGGFCPSSYSTVASYLAQAKGGYCLSSSNGGQQSLNITFNPATAKTASCSSLCSNSVNGSCDGKGFGATNNSTVADYIQSLGGGSTCASTIVNVTTGSSLVAQNSNPLASCTDPANPVFFSSGSAYPGTATNYTAGDVNHHASDFQNFIVSQSTSIFGANLPVVAVFGHQTADTSLTDTQPSTDYFNLANQMGSSQSYSVTLSDYSAALGQISNFIVQKSQNSFALGLPSGSVVYAVSVQHEGTQTWVPLASNLWSWTGGTLSVTPAAGLITGDQLMYQYNN